jgi:putative ABC transport system permease protein
MVAQGTGPAAAGLAIGVLVAVGVTRLLSGILFGVTPTDPATFGEVIALLLAVMALATYLPARRATAVDPHVVLRDGWHADTPGCMTRVAPSCVGLGSNDPKP